MPVEYHNHAIQKIADKIVAALKGQNFVIQRYDSYSTDSVYLKLDYGVCNTIRISDHEGKQYLRYRYNLIIGGENNITDDDYTRYFFNEKSIGSLLNQILFDKATKLQKYGKVSYKNFMLKNMSSHQNDKGFWKDAKLVTKGIDDDSSVIVSMQVPKSRSNSNIPVTLKQMPDGTYACGPDEVLNEYKKVVTNQMQLDANAKFHPNEKVRVIASFDELVDYFLSCNETLNRAKTHALQILSKGFDTEEYDVGTIIGATQCTEGMFYTLDLPLVPMEFLPENFISKL